MKPVKMPKVVYLKGKAAIKALSTFVDELEEKRGEELTDKQTDALIRIANELSSSIKAQIQAETIAKELYPPPSCAFRRIVRPLTKFIS
jgi:hypothetical protein